MLGLGTKQNILQCLLISQLTDPGGLLERHLEAVLPLLQGVDHGGRYGHAGSQRDTFKNEYFDMKTLLKYPLI